MTSSQFTTLSDRRVHASGDGWEVVRYNRAGKWYLERAKTGDRVMKLTLSEAVDWTMCEGLEPRLGVPGGGQFDARVRRWGQ